MRRQFGIGLLLVMVGACGRCGPSGNGSSSGGLTGVDGEAAAENLDFGNVPVGQSDGLVLTIKNIGDSPLQISGLTLSGSQASNFSVGAVLSSSVQAGSSTTVGVRFTPSVAGALAATLTIATDSGSNPNVAITVSGTGTQIDLSVSPEPVNFGQVQVGAPAATIALQLGNTGNLPLTLTASPLTGAQASMFSVGAGFGSLTPGNSQSVTLAFAPTAAGAAIATLPIQVCSGSGTSDCSTLTVDLEGTGVDSQLVYNPDPVAFSMVPAGMSVPQTVTLTNTGTADVSVTQMVTQSGSSAIFDLQSLPSFPANLPAGQAITFTVQYTPSTNPGGDTDAVVATYLASGTVTKTASAPLTGAGIATPCTLTLAPTALTFPGVTVGTAVSEQVTLSNSGTTACSISTIALSASSDPGYSLAAGTPSTVTVPASGSAQIGVQYLLPAAVAPFTRLGTLTFQTTDPTLPNASVPLTANLSLADFPCTLSIAPSSLNYGTVAVSTPTTLQVTVTNIGEVACSLSSVALSATTDPDYSLPATDQSSYTLAAGANVTIGVTFEAPNSNAPLTRTGDLLFDTTDPTQPSVDVPLTAIIGVASPYSAGWPKWHNDNTDQGRTGNDTSKLVGAVKWKFSIVGTGVGFETHNIQSPVVDGNGNVYQMGMDGTFYGVSPAGKQLWSNPLMVDTGGISEDPHPATPIIAKDGTLFVSGGEGGTLYHVAASDGGVLGSAQELSGSDGFDVCPSITNDGGLLLDGDDFGPIAGFTQAALNPSYNSMASFGGGIDGNAERVALAIGPDDTSYWCGDNSCQALSSPRAGFNWLSTWSPAGMVPAPAAPSDNSGTVPEVALDLEGTGNLVTVVGYSADDTTGSIYVSSVKTSNGAINWTVQLPSGTLPNEDVWGGDIGNATPAIGSDGTYYIGSLDGLYALNPTTGATKWSFKSGDVITAPAIGGDGDIFFGDSAGTFYAVHPDGGVRFTVPIGSQISGSPAIGPDGTIFIVADDNNLYAIE